MSESSAEPPLTGPSNHDTDDIAWLNIAENDEKQKVLDVCLQRWRSAAPETRKKMFALFAISGIFIAVCRHGHLLVICDMIRSGELLRNIPFSIWLTICTEFSHRMKYHLAIVNRLFDLYGSDLGLGYDIMCGFIKTLMQSSLGAKAVALHLQGVVPAFHGHAHNRHCQVHWHPLYMEGVGLEDFEECERTFFRSNELASVTRLASPFYRQQQIDEHFYFHDLDKHAASGSYFLCSEIVIYSMKFQVILFTKTIGRPSRGLGTMVNRWHCSLPSLVQNQKIMKPT